MSFAFENQKLLAAPHGERYQWRAPVVSPFVRVVTPTGLRAIASDGTFSVPIHLSDERSPGFHLYQPDKSTRPRLVVVEPPALG